MQAATETSDVAENEVHLLHCRAYYIYCTPLLVCVCFFNHINLTLVSNYSFVLALKYIVMCRFCITLYNNVVLVLDGYRLSINM
jgi:hypothetical protein